MIFYFSDEAEDEFQRNLLDWHRGGPKLGGWTRAGPEIPFRGARLLKYRHGMVDVDAALSKNSAETERWHVSFLKNPSPYQPTPYYQEYLLSRYNEGKAMARLETFLELYDSIKANGVLRPVWVAECPWLGLPLFRFNGCHRICAAKVLGMKQVPALIFKTEVL